MPFFGIEYPPAFGSMDLTHMGGCGRLGHKRLTNGYVFLGEQHEAILDVCLLPPLFEFASFLPLPTIPLIFLILNSHKKQ